MSTNSVSVRAVVEVMRVKETEGGLVSMVISYSPRTATTPLRNYTRLSRNYSLKWETSMWYMAGRVATSTSRYPCRMSWPDPLALIFRTLGPGVPRACNLLLSPPTYTHPSYPTGSESPTHSQQHPFPKPLHSTQRPSPPLPSRPSILCGLWAHHSLPSANGKILFLGRKGGWGTELCPLHGHHLSLALPALALELFPWRQDLMYRLQYMYLLHI